jgi:Carboxypeptidase regulatory-like domain/TonB dependent receptor
MLSSRLLRLIMSTVAIIFMSTMAQAQYRTSIQGVVTDPTGAVVPGATLTLTNPATGEKQVRTSSDAGVYNFNALAAAPFRLEVEAKGFQKKVLDSLQLIPEQANAIDVQLDLGDVGTTVTVNASQLPALDTETASVSGVVSSNQIQHMPSFGRDVLKLAQLAPGMSADGSQFAGGQEANLPGTQSAPTPSGGSSGIFRTENLVQGYSNGNQAQNNGISIDGISTTSAVWGGSTIITPSEDSLDNVKVLTNSYDAEDGRFSGAQLKITSKSGTNDFHGSLFFFTHQPNLNANQPFFGTGTHSVRDNSKFNQFGGSVGGPIWKNKIFAFFAYETVRQPNTNQIGSGWYETSQFAALAPSGSIAATYLGFPGNGVVNLGLVPNTTCASAGLTEGVNCTAVSGGLNLGTPLTVGLGKQDLGWTSVTNPGCGGAGTGCGTAGSPFGTTPDIADYITSNPTTFSAAQYNGRLDADVTGKDRIGFAIYWVPLTKTNFNGNRGYDIFHHDQTNNAFSAIWNRTLSPTFLNEARANAAGWRYNEISSNPQSPVGLPVGNIGQIGSITPTQFGPSVGGIYDQWTYSFKDVATKIIGRHTLKFGGEGTRLSYLQDQPFAGVPHYFFFNLWDFLNDAPKNESGSFDPNTGIPTTLRQDQRENIIGFFAQDDIKVRPNLTLNLGLRWSYFGPLYSKQNNMFRAIPGAGASYLTGLVVRKGNSWNAQNDNFGPEIGFAWSPSKANNRLVFRGGYGLNYNQEELAISANISNNPGLVVSPGWDTNSPTTINPNIIYAVSSSPHNLFGFPANKNIISPLGANGLPQPGTPGCPVSCPVGIQIFPGTLPTMRVHHYSFDMQYDLSHNYVMSIGYQGSLSRDIFFHENPLAVPATLGYPFNAQIGGGDNWNTNGRGNYNAMIAELKHQFSHQFMADAQFTWAKSMDTSSAPYSEQPYPYALNLDYGRSDYNIAHAFKIFGMWQPVFFHGGHGWIEKIAGGWSLSGIFNWHSGFPWTPFVSVQNGSLYCGQCGYGQLFPAASLGSAGTSTSNKAFELPNSSNFPLTVTQGNASAYFSTPTYTAFSGSTFGTALPQSPGVTRNSLTLPGYKDLDLTIAKAFGLPKAPVLGENARLELRLDAYNVFNNLNLNPNNISNNIGNSNFGTISAALAARVLQLGARFSF